MSGIRRKIWIALLCASFVLAALWVGFSIYDMAVYHTVYAFGSAPLYAYLLIRLICFGLPAAGCLLLALVVRKRRSQDENK